MTDLTQRLRGQYQGKFGVRDFSDFIPAISREAADVIDCLEREAILQDQQIIKLCAQIKLLTKLEGDAQCTQ